MQIFKNDWEQYLQEEMQKPYYRELRQFLIGEYRSRQIFPDMYSIFNAMDFCIMTHLGMNVERHPKAMHLIMSRDKPMA